MFNIEGNQTEAGDVNQNDIQQLQNSINQDKPLENAAFDSNFKVEKVPQELTKNFTQTLTKFDVGISQLTSKITSLKNKLKSLLSRKFKPWGLINQIKQQIKMYTQGLKNLKNLKSKFLNQKSKTESQTNQLVNQFTSNNHAKDALYNKGANLISQFPNLNGDFKFLLTPFRLSVNEDGFKSMFANLFGGIGLGVLGGMTLFNSSIINNNIMQIHDVDTLVGMLSSNQEILGNLFNSYQNLSSMEVMETQKLMLLQNDLMRINQGQSFAKMRKAFHKMKETMFKGFAKALNMASKVLDKMSTVMENAAQGLEAAANAAQAIPLVGPAIAAALRMAAKAIRMIAKMLKKAAKFLEQKSKLMENKAKHLNKMQQLMDKKISFLDKLKQKALEQIRNITERLNQIRERKNYVAQMIQQKLIERQMIIQRLMMLGENSSGMGIPGLGMPGLGMPGLGIYWYARIRDARVRNLLVCQD
jgi:hypothetical protein